jgi:predicted O-methyltransferase YrrM
MKDNLYQKFKSNMNRLDGLYKEHRMTTNEAVHLFKDESLDGVFIDADHSYEAVKLDIQNWMPKVRKGGILAGHDYTSAWPGVIRAVDEIFPEAQKIDYCWLKQC